MLCSRFRNTAAPIALNANFNGYDDVAMTVDTTGSIGYYVRIRIRRNGAYIETTAGEVNTGFNVIAYATNLQNGDEIIVEVSNSSLFYPIDQESRFIPTPGITSPTLMPSLQFSFEAASSTDAFAAPNSNGSDTLTWTFEFLDENGNAGTITMIGPKVAFQETDDLAAYNVDPTTGTEVISTSFGDISVNRTFDPLFDLNLNKTVVARLTDQLGMKSAEDYCGLTCVLFSDNSTYLTDADSEPLTYSDVSGALA